MLIFGVMVFLFVAFEGVFAERNFLQYRAGWAGFTITMVEVALTTSIALILTMLFGQATRIGLLSQSSFRCSVL